jgi:hypothetical protein
MKSPFLFEFLDGLGSHLLSSTRHQGGVAGQDIQQQENDEGHTDNGGDKLQ